MRRWGIVDNDRQDRDRQAKVGPTFAQRNICHSSFNRMLHTWRIWWWYLI